MSKRTRVVEEIDSDGDSRFYPEYKGLLFGWNRVSNKEWGEDIYCVSFNSLKEAESWVNYRHTAKTKIHTGE